MRFGLGTKRSVMPSVIADEQGHHLMTAPLAEARAPDHRGFPMGPCLSLSEAACSGWEQAGSV
jgi:hypothetical protein